MKHITLEIAEYDTESNKREEANPDNAVRKTEFKIRKSAMLKLDRKNQQRKDERVESLPVQESVGEKDISFS